ncbi:MAG: hypothetical protein ABFS46_07775, partial [Myxococcota bacterium]
AATALLQLGFVHGLRDATRVVALEGSLGALPTHPTASRIAMRFTRRPVAPGEDGIEVQGSWPEARESYSAEEGVGGEIGCPASAGYTSGWLSGLFGVDILAVETTCAGRGGPACGFEAREAASWIESEDCRAHRLLARLPFDRLRSSTSPPAPAPEPEAGSATVFDPDSPAVHVWGPVMVIPFSGADETLRAIELIGQDPGAGEVSVVVLDLTGTLVDDGFGALALERAIEAIASWGAETLLTGVSPLSEPAVAGLEQPHLVMRKDLPAAIAAAFQIAETTRRPV